MKFLLLIMIFISCNDSKQTDDENPFASLNESSKEENTQGDSYEDSPKENKVIKSISIDEESCVYGCSYSYKILKGSKIADKDSISLSISQLNSIKEECVNKCLAVYK